MELIEVSGRTLEEALQAAALELGVSTDAIDYEIVEEGAKGFLGLGQTPTTVKARIKDDYTGPIEPPSQAPQPEVSIEDISDEEPVPESEEAYVDKAVGMVGDIVKAMGIDVGVKLKSVQPDEITIDIEGEDTAILIGKHGQTIDALQYLVGLIVNKDFDSRRRIILDAEGYRARHREMLENKAREYADAVKSAGKEAVLDPQPARDRRICTWSWLMIPRSTPTAKAWAKSGTWSSRRRSENIYASTWGPDLKSGSRLGPVSAVITIQLRPLPGERVGVRALRSLSWGRGLG